MGFMFSMKVDRQKLNYLTRNIAKSSYKMKNERFQVYGFD